jgi:SAM-dependent methyltransferase
MAGPPDDELSRHVGRLVFGSVIAKTVYAVVKLRVPDSLADGPLPIDELARRVGADRDALARVLRALVNERLFDEPQRGTFALTDAGRLLVAGSPAYFDALMNIEHVDPSFDQILHSVRTGEPAGPRAFGKPYFEWLGDDPGRAQVFNDAMSDGARARLPSLLALDLWNDVRRVVDVGGGNGTALAALLREHPHLLGVDFDLPHAAADATAVFERQRISDRATFVAGDFFDGVPAGADAYVLVQILHDWSDDDALRILRTVRAAIPPEGMLVVVELVLSEGTEPQRAHWLDVLMLVLLGGRERTETEWRELLERGGFALDHVVGNDRAAALLARPV